MNDIIRVLIMGIAVTAGIYVLIANSNAFKQEAGGFTDSYAKVAKAFQGQ